MRIDKMVWRQWRACCKAMIDNEDTSIDHRPKWAQLWFKASLHCMRTPSNID